MPSMPNHYLRSTYQISNAQSDGVFARIDGKDHTAESVYQIVRAWQNQKVTEERTVFLEKVEVLARDHQQPALHRLVRHLLFGIDRGGVIRLLNQAQVQIAPFARANTYAEWKYQCQRVDLEITIRLLKNILAHFSQDVELQEAFIKSCRQRHVGREDTDLDYINDPESPCNLLLIAVAKQLFPIQTMGELVGILYPDVTHTYELAIEQGKLTTRHVRLGESVNTTAYAPICASELQNLIVLGHTAIFSHDYEGVASTPKNKYLAADFWQAMQFSSPGLFEKLTASSRALQEIATQSANQSPLTPSLRNMLLYLVDAFRKNSAHGGIGNSEVAGSGAGLALEYFERDWALFEDRHQSDVGRRIQDILNAVRNRFCVHLAARSIDSVFANNANDPIWAETRPRPQIQPDHQPCLLVSEVPQRLPAILASLCGPEIRDCGTLLPYLLDMPTTMYPLLVANLDIHQLASIHSIAAPLSDLQRQALAEATSKAVQACLLSATETGRFTEPLASSLRRLLSAQGAQHRNDLLLSIMAMNNLAVWQAVLNLFATDLPALKTLLCRAIQHGQPFIDYIIDLDNSAVWQTVLNLFSQDFQQLQALLLSENDRFVSLFHRIFRRPRPDIKISLFNILARDFATLKKFLFEGHRNTEPFVFYISYNFLEEETWQTVLNLFSQDVRLCQELLLARNARGYSLIHMLVTCRHPHIWQPVLNLFSGDINKFRELLLVADSSEYGPTLFSDIIKDDWLDLWDSVLRPFDADVTHLQELMNYRALGMQTPIQQIVEKGDRHMWQGVLNTFASNLGSLRDGLLAKNYAAGQSSIQTIMDYRETTFLDSLRETFSSQPEMLNELLRSTRKWRYVIGAINIGLALAAIALSGVFIAQALVASGVLAGKLVLLPQITALNTKIAAIVAGSLGSLGILFTAAGIYAIRKVPS